MVADTRGWIKGGRPTVADILGSDSPRHVKRTIEEMTPQDVTKRREGRVQELRNAIKRYKEYIAKAEAEIEAWENL